MFNAKACGIAASVGFVLSFFIGLCCRVRFGHVVLRAFLFAILCGVLCFVVEFVFKRFLKNPTENEVSESSSNENASVGSMVDITVGEESLPDDESEPSFSVNQTVTEEKPNFQETGFVSTSVENLTSASSKNRVAKDNSSSDDLEIVIDEDLPLNEGEKSNLQTNENIDLNKKVNNVTNSSSSEDLDLLPDFGDMSSSFSSNEEKIEDSSESFSSSSVSHSDLGTDGTSVQDADVVAQAIRTMLNGD